MALGRTSSMMPASILSFVSILRSFSSGSAGNLGKHSGSDLFGRSDPIYSAKNAEIFVVREKGRRLRVVSVEAGLHFVLVVVGPMFELGSQGRRTVLEVVDLSSPFIRAA